LKILQLFTITALLACSALAQSGASDSGLEKEKAKTKPLVVKTASVESASYRTFTATAYSLRGYTASGERVRSGIIAADPRVLPIGTVVHIEGMGTFVVKDTGGAIKGNRIDIWMASGAMKFGRRKVQLRIISKPRRT
jgi:3D (Asp-Asp-Asp) domain-containing protein